MTRKCALPFLLIALTALTFGCRKQPPIITNANVKFHLSYNVDGDPLAFDQVKYTNAAGNEYSVTRMDYFLSDFVFHNTDGTKYMDSSYHFVSARTAETNLFTLNAIPNGQYSGITFFIGIDAPHNVPNGLPAEQQYSDMEWPIPMGGGYHFIRFEGHFLSGGSDYGFAMHVGLNPFLMTVHIDYPFEINSATRNLDMAMNINEWFENPDIFNFEVDNNYTMGDTVAMGKLKANGEHSFQITKSY